MGDDVITKDPGRLRQVLDAWEASENEALGRDSVPLLSKTARQRADPLPDKLYQGGGDAGGGRRRRGAVVKEIGAFVLGVTILVMWSASLALYATPARTMMPESILRRCRLLRNADTGKARF